MKYSKDCDVCRSTFETNYASKITCNDECKEERKRLQKIKKYHSESGYKAHLKEKKADFLIKKRNEFLLRKVG